MSGRLDEWIRVLSAAVSRAEPATIDRLAVSELVALIEELASWRSLRVRVTATLADDEIVPQRDAYYLVVDGGEDDGDDVDVPVRADRLAAEIVRRCTGEVASLAEELQQELAELRGRYATEHTLRLATEVLLEQLRRPLTVYGIWTPGNPDPIPARIGVTADGDDVELMLDALPLIEGALERQAKAWVRAAELTPAVPLEQLVAMVPAQYALATSLTERHLAWWHGIDEGILAQGAGRTRAAAIRAATIALLRGRKWCGTCWNWGKEGETGDIRTCLIDPQLYRKTAASSCSGVSWRPARWLEPEPGDGEGGQC